MLVRPSKYRCLKYLSIPRVLRANMRFGERASALGWTEERIVVIDQDLGHSGASTADRLGFQWLVAEVGL